ncbi:hypothetical protein [Myxococcus sp. CA056]|uniref:hypothetical protein n=1 Tax=Myxococcus sp. CA056 TaxID=2741740 RepID=UPI00157A7BED|nr:hypothetical protein [Myxococcus sp. CA056]
MAHSLAISAFIDLLESGFKQIDGVVDPQTFSRPSKTHAAAAQAMPGKPENSRTTRARLQEFISKTPSKQEVLDTLHLFPEFVSPCEHTPDFRRISQPEAKGMRNRHRQGQLADEIEVAVSVKVDIT